MYVSYIALTSVAIRPLPSGAMDNCSSLLAASLGPPSVCNEKLCIPSDTMTDTFVLPDSLTPLTFNQPGGVHTRHLAMLYYLLFLHYAAISFVIIPMVEHSFVLWQV